MKRVMFVCQRNAHRSQMAEGFARALSNGTVEVRSAGLEASYVDPMTVQVMDEVGINIARQSSKALDDFQPEDFDVVISLCGHGLTLPAPWLTRGLFAHWQLDDAEGREIETFRHTREQVKGRVIHLLAKL